jgi:hypothetical protein
MLAMVVGPSPVISSLSLYFVMLTVVPIGLLLAPQPVRRDKRTIVTLLLLAAVVIGVPVYAVVCNVCEVCKGDYWWLYMECWFL